MRPERGFLVLSAALCALAPLSIDLGLPALGPLTRALGVAPARGGLTLAVFMAGFALTPLVFGTLSDRRGRRGPLLAGLLLYGVGGLVCTLAGSFDTLLAGRLLQGMGAGAGPTLAMAATRDRLHDSALERRLSALTACLNLAPVIAPSLGTALLALGGWRAPYATLAAAGLLLLAACMAGFAETHRVADRPHLRTDLAELIRAPRSLAMIGVYAASAASMFAWVTLSPLVLMERLHVAPPLYAALFALAACGIVTGAVLSPRLAARIGTRRLLAAALALSIAAPLLAAVLLVLAPDWRALMPTMIAATFAYGLIAPTAAHAALDPLPRIAGTASAVMNAAQVATMAAASALASWAFTQADLFALPVAMTVFALLSAAIVLFQPAGLRAG